MPNIVLLGIQGSGKGTQANLIEKKFGYTHLNVGSLLRREMEKKSEIGKYVESYMLRGDLVPDECIFSLISPIITEGTSGLVLDGFPRTLNQAEYLESKVPVSYAVYFKLDDAIAKERLNNRRVCQQCLQNYNLLLKNGDNMTRCSKCGTLLELRSDDNELAINRRIEAFHQQTKPVIDFFFHRNKLITLEATDKPQAIHKKLVKLLEL